MSWYRKNPLFAVGLTICALLALGELAFTYERWAASREAAKRLEQRKTDLESMTQLTPPPTREVATAIETDLAKAQAALASMQSELKGRGPAAEKIRSAKIPPARTDAYFDLTTFVERSRELAKKLDVEVRPEAARFGFAEYTNQGPEEAYIEPVFRQRQIAQYLVESLIEAKPRALFEVRREPTMTKAQREERAAAIAAAANGGPPVEPLVVPDGPDYFTIDPRVSARSPNYIETTAFRFVFTGQTAALRTFLNRLASFELPVLVREVEVAVATAEEATTQVVVEDPANADQTAAGAASPSVVLSVEPSDAAAKPAAKAATPPRVSRAATATPIVSKPLSKFTVTVEFVELVTPPPAADGTPTPPTPGS